MWINRSKFEQMERDIKSLNDCVSSLKRINRYAGDEPTFRVGEKIKTNSADDGLAVYLACIYLYIDRNEYVIDAPELPSLRDVDYEHSRLKITSTGFAYINVCIDNGLYKYVSAYKDETCIYLGREDISKRDAEVTSELDPYRFHDLREDPTDLPEKYGEDWVLVKLDCTGIDEKPFIAICLNGRWFSDSFKDESFGGGVNVLGWFRIYDPCLSSRKNPNL